MKKLTITVMLFLMGLILIACQAPPIDEDALDRISMALQFKLPGAINADFTLPQHPEATITWHSGEEDFGPDFIYTPPLFDKDIILTAIITADAGGTRSAHYPVLLLAPESSRHRYQVEITMEQGLHQINRDHYVNISFKLTGHVNDVMTTLYQTHLAELRGRGNSTWFMPKKPLRVRLGDAAALLDMPEARNYVLLAEYADKSLMRNTVVHWFTQFLEHLDHAISTRYVELYVNGHYEGVYVLTEHVEAHPNKLALNAPLDPDSQDVGYFMELDQRFYEHGHTTGTDWFTVAGVPYHIKTPSSSNDATMQSYNAFIRQYITEMEAALIAKNGYEAYMDVDNFIDYFIVHELFKNVDVGWSSVFMYKQPGEPLRMGPIWDFDLAIGNADYMSYGYGPEGFHGMREKNRWFTLMMQIPEVRTRFRQRYSEIHTQYVPQLLEALPILAESLRTSSANNFARWPILTHYVWPNPPELVALHTHAEQAQFLVDYIEARSRWMYFEVHSNAFQYGLFD